MPSVDPLSTTIVSYCGDAVQAALQPGQRVVRHDDDRDVSHGGRTGSAGRRRLSHARIERAGNRHGDRDEEEEEPGGEGGVGGHAELAEEADEERLAHGEPVDVNGTSMTRKSSGPIT